MPDELDYKSEAKHTVGFFLGIDKESPYMLSVFSFRTGKEILIHEEKIRAVPPAFAEKLDKNPDFSAVREVRFLKDHDPTLKTYLPTEPGDHVYLNGEKVTIVEVEGTQYCVEDGDGSHFYVQAGDLVAGKTISTARWNPKSLGSFTSISPDTIYEGEWVWIDAGALVQNLIDHTRRRDLVVPPELEKMRADNKVLALVKSIHGGHVEVVRAFDGEELDLEVNQVLGSSNSIEKTLDHDVKLAKWKTKTLLGIDPHLNPPGTVHPMLTLGLGELDDELLAELKMKPHMRFAEERETESGPIDVVPGAGQIETNIRKRDAQDELNDIQNFRNWRTQVVEMKDMTGRHRTAEPNSSAFIWVAGAIVLVAYFSQ